MQEGKVLKTLSGKGWSGSFRPIGYRFTGWALAVQLATKDGSVKSQSLGGAYGKLRRTWLFRIPSISFRNAVYWQILRSEGESFPRDVLRSLLTAEWAGDCFTGDEALWFFYRTSKSRDEFSGDEAFYHFFIVANDKIVLEDAWLRDSPDSGFDPEMFSIAGDEAEAPFWYRKFYRETRTGQLMVLRPDKPELFHYAEGRTPNALGLANMQAALNYDFSRTRAAVARLERRLRTTNRFLLVLLVAAILALIHFWR